MSNKTNTTNKSLVPVSLTRVTQRKTRVMTAAKSATTLGIRVSQETAQEQKPITWSKDGLVMFLDGYAWTSLILNGHLEHICLGKEDNVRAILTGEKPITEAGSLKREQAFIRIFEIREEIGEPTVAGTGVQRTGFVRPARHQRKAVEQAKTRKGVPLRSAHR